MEYSGWAHKFSPIVSMWAYNDNETQISREGERYQLPSDVAKLSFFVKLCLDTKDIEDGGDTDRHNGNGGEVVHEIPLYAINSFVLAEIIKYMVMNYRYATHTLRGFLCQNLA